jgi:mannose-6-phosphate isomerase-like protein (cupin superfamily)
MPAEVPTHYVGRIDWSQAALPTGYERASAGFLRQQLVDGATGSVHMGVAACMLAGDGHVRPHVHSFEESFYVLEGGIQLTMQGKTVDLGPDHCGLIPVGVPHSWTGAGTGGRWIEMAAPRPRAPSEGRPADTFFVEEAGPDGTVAAPADIRDPRTRHVFRLNAIDTDIEALRRGSSVDAPTVSASMATALLVYSGIAVKMLVDQRLDAQLSTMFMVEYQPGGVAHPHDHPLEEFYAILDGEVEAVADGSRYTLRQGDVFWTGVGCVHAFYNTSDGTVRWLETQAPQPPARHSYRFDRDWEYLGDRLKSRRG